MTLEQILGLLTGGSGVVAVLILIIYGGHRKWWVFGWIYAELEEDRDFYRNLATKAAATTSDAVTIVKKSTE